MYYIAWKQANLQRGSPPGQATSPPPLALNYIQVPTNDDIIWEVYDAISGMSGTPNEDCSEVAAL